MDYRYDRYFLEALLRTASPSGFETKAAEIWRSKANNIVGADSVDFDVHGNSFAMIKAKNGKPPIMLAGHIDEIGLMVSYVDPDGFIYFRPIGGWDPQILPNQRVKIYGKDGKCAIKGVIGRTPIHLFDEKSTATKIADLWIDTGLGKRAVERVSVGDYVVIDCESELDGDILISRGLDDKIGAFIALEVLRTIIQNNKGKKPEYSVCAVATVQEEVGLRGAKTSAYGLNPVIGIAIDVTHATDNPGADKRKQGDIKLGAGPVIAVGPNINMEIYNLLVKTAKKFKIPYQIKAAPGGTGTDANAIQLTRAGVATGLVSIPNRYMHSPNEMVDMNDVENAIKLLAGFLELSLFEK